MKKIIYTLLAIIIFSGASCSRKERVAYPDAPVADLVAVMREWPRGDSARAADTLRKYRPEITALMAAATSAPAGSRSVADWSQSLVVERFTPPVDSVFPSPQPLRQALGHILGTADGLGLNLPRRRYAAVVYGRGESVLFVDSVMLIALNHYLGPEFEGYSSWPAYRRLDKKPERLPYDIAEALVGTEYPYRADGGDATLLSAMLYHGALTCAKMRLVDGARLSEALGYDEAEMKLIQENESEIWNGIVASGLLYDTSAATTARYVNPSPSVRLGGAVWPARIGRFIGWRMVEKYVAAHPETSLSYLLSPEFYTSAEALVSY